MLTSVRGPMLGTHSGQRWGRRFMRYDRSLGKYARFEIRAARRFERELWTVDLDDEVTEKADPRTDDYWGHVLDNDTWLAQALGDHIDTPACGCYCRRCVLHDDHGGCTSPWEHRTGVFHADNSNSEGGFYA